VQQLVGELPMSYWRALRHNSVTVVEAGARVTWCAIRRHLQVTSYWWIFMIKEWTFTDIHTIQWYVNLEMTCGQQV